MSLTLLALSLTPLYLWIVLSPQAAHKGMKEVFASHGLRLAFSWSYLILALLILSATGLSSFNFESWDSLLPWIGLLIGLKGAFILLFPTFYGNVLKKLKHETYPILGFIGLLFALFMVYVDTQLI